jgi:hypothetical protein
VDRLRNQKLSKYLFTAKDRINLVKRMYQDHGFDIEEICLRLRYSEETVKQIIEKYKLIHGEKSWRY